MGLELKLDADAKNEFYFKFKEGMLLLFFPDESTRDKPTEMSRLQFGKVLPSRNQESFPYFISLSALKKMKKGYPLTFKELDTFTDGRRTITGGLRLRRRLPSSYFLERGLFEETKFSRKEYKTIKQYL